MSEEEDIESQSGQEEIDDSEEEDIESQGGQEQDGEDEQQEENHTSTSL